MVDSALCPFPKENESWSSSTARQRFPCPIPEDEQARDENMLLPERH